MEKEYFKKLQELRISKNLSYNEMAKRLGISKCFYWQIENKKRHLTYIMAYKIANILNTKPDELFLDDFKSKLNF